MPYCYLSIIAEQYRPSSVSRGVFFSFESRRVSDDGEWRHVGKHDYHKLPGGGVDEGEDIKEALRREYLEEVGAEITIGNYIGEVVEYKTDLVGTGGYMIQISLCYICHMTNQGGHSFTDSEKEENFSHKWFTLEEAIQTLESDNPDNEEGKYILQRELTFLKNI